MGDTFIPGIYNYCNRWCERCAFTERCLVFASVRYHDAVAAGQPAEDPHERLERENPPTAEVEAFLKEVAEAQAAMTDEDLAEADREERAVDARVELDPLMVLAKNLSCALWEWSKSFEPPANDPLLLEGHELVSYYGLMLGVKVNRALHGHYRALLHGDPLDDALATAKLTLRIVDELRGAVELLALVYPADGALRRGFAELPVLDAMLRERFPRAEGYSGNGLDDGSASRAMTR